MNWVCALLRRKHKAEAKFRWKKSHKKCVKIRRLILRWAFIEMKLPGTGSLLKERYEKKWAPTFWEWDAYILAGTPTFYKR